VTVVGAGGIGKTTVAIEVGHNMLDAFAGAVLFVDLGMLSDPKLVTTAVASMLGLSIQSNDPLPGLIAFLRHRRVLLVLDTCEHLIEAAATLAARLFAAAPDVHILATSREAMQVEGERVYRLAPLACPSGDGEITAAVVQRFPATKLFIEKAAASGAKLDLNGSDAAIVADICRQLDGVALAIELAARRVEAYALRQIATHLDQRLALLWAGRRSAPPRQKTLRATLEWSYGLLSELERTVLRRLAVFVGSFTIDAALAVAVSATVDQAAVFGAVDSLVSKSMVAAQPVGAMMRYRLLDTTRAYALEIGSDDAERSKSVARHACYYRDWLRQTGAASRVVSRGAERADHLVAINNIRAALVWCFSEEGDVRIGVELATAAAPVFLADSLLPECHRWSERTLRERQDADIGGWREMHLQAALGVSLMFTRGGLDAARVALERSLAIAESRGDASEELQVLGPLQMFYLRRGDFRTALHYATRCCTAAEGLDDLIATTMARALLGTSLHLCGDQRGARTELEAALRHEPLLERTTTICIGFECSILARGLLARTLWMLGYPVQAAAQARRAVKDAAEMGHPLTLSIALIWAISVFLQIGDLESAEAHIDWQVSCAGSHSLAPHLAVGRAFEAELAIRRGRGTGGIESLEASLEVLRTAPYALLTTPLKIVLIEALVTGGRLDEGFVLLDSTIHEVESNGDVCYMPELLRVRARLLLAGSSTSGDVAQQYLLQSLEISREQGARAWELRAGTDLARLWIERGHAEQARALLQPLAGQYADGEEATDVEAARSLLKTFGEAGSGA
jgi:predicted ATPase